MAKRPKSRQLDLLARGPADLYAFEREARARGYGAIAGVDEAGRGPLAGPVVAAAVILPEGSEIPGLGDSKVIAPERREILFEEIHMRAQVGVGVATHEEIDTINILRASHLAMCRAVEALRARPDFLLIDGHLTIPSEIAQRAIVKGDARSASVGAASIIAKVTRDQMMREACARFPGYGFSQHKGYPTRDHFEALRRQGPSPIHRRTFRGVAEPRGEG
ncbi:MAG: ribonuclease HII [Myxococcales bacterium]|nr:ribonuclease HII [Myxococcales bacterium]